jgi:hypothetical protein
MKGRYLLGNPNVHGRILLKWILKEETECEGVD